MANLKAPEWERIGQAAAVTAQSRRPEDILHIVIHVPDGAEDGQISWQYSAGNHTSSFDYYRSPSRRFYIVNDWRKFIAWHTGYWPYNLNSLGIERGDFERNVKNATDADYRADAYIVAWLQSQLPNVPLRYAGRSGDPGIIGHMDVPDGRGGWGGQNHHTDPGPDYDFEKLIAYARAAGGSAASGSAGAAGAANSVLDVDFREAKDMSIAWRVKHCRYDLTVSAESGAEIRSGPSTGHESIWTAPKGFVLHAFDFTDDGQPFSGGKLDLPDTRWFRCFLNRGPGNVAVNGWFHPSSCGKIEKP